MCGIVGFADPNHKVSRDMRRMALAFQYTRGIEGFGSAWQSQGKDGMEWVGIKEAVSVLDFIANPDKPKEFLDANVMLSHVRRPSRCGDSANVTKANTHPFLVGSTCLAHNGFIQNAKEVAEELAKDEKYKKIAENYIVDSHVAAAAVDKWGHEALGRLKGSASLWWLNPKDLSSFYLWCWHQDLSIYQGESVFAFSSELMPLKLCEFKDACKIDPDEGSLLKVDIATGVYTVEATISGKAETVTVHTASHIKDSPMQPTASVKNNYTLWEAQGLLSGYFVGWCPDCIEYVAYDEVHVKMNDKNNRRMYCIWHDHGIVVPLDKQDRKDALAKIFKTLSHEEREALRKYYQDTPSLQGRCIAFFEIEKDDYKFPEHNVLWWKSTLPKDREDMYNDAEHMSNDVIVRCCEGLKKADRKNMTNGTNLGSINTVPFVGKSVTPDFDSLTEDDWRKLRGAGFGSYD